MSSEVIEQLKKEYEGSIQKKKSTKLKGLLMLVFLIIFGVVLIFVQSDYGWLWLAGVGIGLTLQRSKFCFSASFRDPILTGSTSLLRAVIVGIGICTIGFAIIQGPSFYMGVLDFELIPGLIKPVGIHTALGALMFGAGMVVAGGCASGTLMRIGEGFKLQIVALTGFVIGTTLAASHFEFWDVHLIQKSMSIYLPHLIG